MPRACPQEGSAVSARRGSARRGPVAGTAAPGGTAAIPARLITSKMIGDLPSFNDWMRRIADGNRLYLFGGCRQNDSNPSSDFYRWDLQDMRWTNLTVRKFVSFIIPRLNFSRRTPRATWPTP
jgi:hypothetical protein